MLYGDGAITPAISVLSAIEGLKVDAPASGPVRGADHAGDPGRRCSWSSTRAWPPSAGCSGPSCWSGSSSSSCSRSRASCARRRSWRRPTRSRPWIS
ncbi:KUP/HAK/KT family potassium transporter [Methylobacterium oryzae CBMB20]